MKSNVLSLGRAVAVLRRIGGARRLCFQWTAGQHESQHDFDFLRKCLGHSHVEPAVIRRGELSFQLSILCPMRQNHV